MKGMLKKFMVYTMVGLMQAGLFATVVSANPKVEEPPMSDECCGDPICMADCIKGVTPECKQNHHKKTLPKENNDRQNNNRQNDNRIFQDQSNSTCDN